jgi:hypothetical protein
LQPNFLQVLSARKVKIQLPGKTEYLHFAEMEVYDGSGSNIARGKDTAQSSTYQSSSNYASGKAVDGDKNTYSHTNSEYGKIC